MTLKDVKSDKFYCESIAKSISEIIRFSFDEEFRKSSFKLFGVSSTKETEKEISKRLMSIIENVSASRQNKTSRKRRKKLTQGKDKGNLDQQQHISDVKNINQSSSTITNCEVQNAASQILPHNFFQKNWLQISSQRYRDVVKRRKLNYFSQPQFSYTNESDIEFSSSNSHSSNSEPTTSNINNCLYNDKTASSLQLSDDGINFCQKMFKVSFKDNAQKYLKKNSKSHKHLSF